MFRAGLAVAALGLVWTLWPAPGARAYNGRGGHSVYHHLGPRVALDLGHFNTAPADARFLALDDLLLWDGYRVSRSKQYLVPEYLKDFHVLIIGNARPYPAWLATLAAAVGLTGRSAFAPDEVDVVRDWVRRGGSLLLIADAPGTGHAITPLAAAFGLRFHDCATPEFLRSVETGEHAIVRGRAENGERIEDMAVLGAGWIEAADSNAVPLLRAPAATTCAALKPLAVALELGRGRVVALSAQLERDDDLVRRTGIDPRNFDNRQFLLNAMHWLSHAAE